MPNSDFCSLKLPAFAASGFDSFPLPSRCQLARQINFNCGLADVINCTWVWVARKKFNKLNKRKGTGSVRKEKVKKRNSSKICDGDLPKQIK